MGSGVALAQKLQQEILELPKEALPELEQYIEFLRFKVRSTAKPQKRARSDRQSAARADRSTPAYLVDSETVKVTEVDVAAAQAQLVRPHSAGAVHELAQAYKLAQQEVALSEEERDKRFRENIEAIRSEAIAAGTAIDEPADALADD
jgi:hypothetical protein